jgi:peroxiredoxin
MYGKEYEGVLRTTYVINEEGKIDSNADAMRFIFE